MLGRILEEIAALPPRDGVAPTSPPAPRRSSSRPCRGLGDGEREALGEAGVTPVVHVQPVGGDEGRDDHHKRRL
jgi:hypothetical protein